MNRQTKRLSTAIFLSGALFATLYTQHADAASKTATVDTTVLNVRQSSSTSSPIVGKLTKGTKVSVLSTKGSWAQIEYKGQKRYVSSTYLKMTSTSSTSAQKVEKVYSVTENLNLRSSASLKASVLLTIPKNKEVQYISKSGNWYRVKYGSKTGYVSSQYVRSENKVIKEVMSTVSKTSTSSSSSLTNSSSTKNVYTTTVNLNMRTKASTSGSRILTIPKGKEIQYISKSGSWYRVKYGSKTGYVSSSYIKATKVSTPAAKPPATKPPTTNATSKTYKTTENLNLHSSASTSGKILVTIPKNKTVKYISTSSSWYRVQYGSKTGYVSSKYLSEIKPTPPKPTAPVVKKYYYTTVNLNLRDKASTSGSLLMTILPNEKVEYVSSYGDWYKVKYDGKTGYVAKQYLTEKAPAKPSVPADDTDYEIKYEAVVTVDGLNVRSTPGVTSTNKIGQLEKNQIIGVIKDVNSDWSQIEYVVNDKFVTAYVSRTYIKPYTGPSVPETVPGSKNVVLNYSDYEYKLTDMVDIQKRVNAQTDKYSGTAAYVSKQYVELIEGTKTGRITVSGLHVRSDSNTNSHIYGILNLNSIVNVLGVKDNFYQISYERKTGESERVFDNTWRLATEEDILNRVDPRLVEFEKALESPYESFQFLDLSKPTNASATILNKALVGKGILAGQAQAFIDAGKAFNINEVYLMSHAFLETGNGTSTLAKGVWVDENGKLLLNKDGTLSTTGYKKVYNMYGIGAKDVNVVAGGAKYAFDNGWTTPAKAIYGGGQWISERYINNSRQQNTLYKMRFNPAKPGTYQYATDIGWAFKQTYKIHEIYKLLDSYTAEFDIPRFIY